MLNYKIIFSLQRIEYFQYFILPLKRYTIFVIYKNLILSFVDFLYIQMKVGNN